MSLNITQVLADFETGVNDFNDDLLAEHPGLLRACS